MMIVNAEVGAYLNHTSLRITSQPGFRLVLLTNAAEIMSYDMGTGVVPNRMDDFEIE